MIYSQCNTKHYNKENAMAKRGRRAKGEGSVYLRRGIWYAQWRADGVTHRESTGIRESDKDGSKTSRMMAEDWLADKTEPMRLRRKADGIAVLMRQMQTIEERIASGIEAARHRTTLGELEPMFRDSPRRPDCSADMLEFYCGIIRRYAESVGADTEVESVGDAEAGEYAKRIGATMAAGTYNKVLNALTLVWRVCGREAGVKGGENPWKGLARRKSDAHVRRPFTREETDVIIGKAQGEMRTLVAVCLYTGLRLGDACQLKWEDIRGDAVYVITAKRDRKVAIPLHPILKAELGEVKRRGYVMPSVAQRYTANKQGPSNVSRSLKRVIEHAGIKTSIKGKDGSRARPDATAHSFRHTFVTRAIEAGVPPHVVQAIVGHASATMTERYTHLSDDAVLAAFKTMA